MRDLCDTTEFGKGYTERNLRAMRQFYLTFPIRHTLCAELSWSHYRLLMQIDDIKRREFYLTECAEIFHKLLDFLFRGYLNYALMKQEVWALQELWKLLSRFDLFSPMSS